MQKQNLSECCFLWKSADFFKTSPLCVWSILDTVKIKLICFPAAAAEMKRLIINRRLKPAEFSLCVNGRGKWEIHAFTEGWVGGFVLRVWRWWHMRLWCLWRDGSRSRRWASSPRLCREWGLSLCETCSRVSSLEVWQKQKEQR